MVALSLPALPPFSVFFPVVPHSSFVVSLLLSLPLTYPHVFDVQISKSPTRYHLLHEAISGISWDYLTPFDFLLAFALFCFHALFLFPICEPDAEPAKAQPCMCTALSLYPWSSTPSSHLLSKTPPRVWTSGTLCWLWGLGPWGHEFRPRALGSSPTILWDRLAFRMYP